MRKSGQPAGLINREKKRQKSQIKQALQSPTTNPAEIRLPAKRMHN